MTRELLGEAACLARLCGTYVAALTDGSLRPEQAAAWGSDHVVTLDSPGESETVLCAAAFASWCAEHRPWTVLARSSMWGREVARRIAVRLDCGLIADITELEVADDRRLVCWKPAFSAGRCSRGLRARSARLLRNRYRTTTESLSRQLTRYYGDHEFGAGGG